MKKSLLFLLPLLFSSVAYAQPTEAAISVSGGTGTGGAFIVGNTVTAQWDNNIDGATGVTAVTFDFTEFGGGAAVVASDIGGGVYEASYIIAAPGTTESTTADVSVTVVATTGGGSVTDNEDHTVDDILPTSIVTIDSDPISLGDLTQVVTVTYSEAMDAGTNPTIGFDNSGNFTTAGDGAWSTITFTNDTWTETFNHDGTAEEIAAETVTVASASGATDVAGNSDIGDTSPAFLIDTQSPTAIVTVDSDPISPADLIQVVTVTYDEAMNGGTNPVIGFTNSGNFTTAGDGAWSTVTFTNDTWTESFNHSGASEQFFTETAVVASASGATDVVGNDDIGDTSPNFVLDTQAPTAVVTIDSDPINLGDLTQVVTVTYDEAMDNGTNPTIGFDNSPNFTTAGDGAWSTVTFTNDTWTETFNHDGTAEEIAAETVTVASASGATDVVGIADVGDTSPSFEVDTQVPTFVDATFYDTDSDGSVDEILLEFSEDVDESSVTDTDFNIGATGFGSTTFTVFNSGFPAGNTIDASLTDNYITLVVDLGSTDDQSVVYNQGGLADETGNLAASNAGLTTFDLAPPVLTDVQIEDTDSDGLIDRVVYVFSEVVSDADDTDTYVVAEVGSITLPDGQAAAGFVDGDISLSNDGTFGFVTIDNITGQVTQNTSVGSLDVGGVNGFWDDDQNLTSIGDGAEGYIDAASPIFIDATFYDVTTQDGVVDEILIEFSEDIDESSVDDADFDIGGAGLGVVTFTVTAGASANNGVDINDSDEYVTLAVSLNTTDDRTVVYTQNNDASDVADNDLNQALNDAGLTTIDLAAPVLTDLRIEDTDNDGIIDQMTYVFSEIVFDIAGGVTDGDIGTLTMPDGSTFDGGGGNALGDANVSLTNDGTFGLVVMDVASAGYSTVGTDALASDGTGAALNFDDDQSLVGVEIAENIDDQAKPRIMSVVISGNSIADVTFSEPIWSDAGNTSAVGTGNFSFTIGGALTAPSVDGINATSEENPTPVILVGGEEEVRIFFSFTGSAVGGETLTMNTDGGIYDDSNNTADATQYPTDNQDQLAAPAIPDMSIAEWLDQNNDGDIDAVAISFNVDWDIDEFSGSDGADGLDCILIQNGASTVTQDNEDYDSSPFPTNGFFNAGQTVTITFAGDPQPGTSIANLQVTYQTGTTDRIESQATEDDAIPGDTPDTHFDDAAPRFSNFTATILDDNADGNVDRILVDAQDNIDDTAIDPSEFTYNGVAATGIANSDNTDQSFTLLFSGNGTAVEGDFVYTPGVSLLDTAANASNGGTIGSGSVVDGAGPVILNALTLDTEATPNGEIDEILVTFSENLANIYGDDTYFSVGSGAYPVTNAVAGGSPDEVVLTITESGAFDTFVVPDVEMTIAGYGDDAAGALTPLQTFTNTSDGAAPYSQVDVLATADASPDLSGDIDDPNATVLVNVSTFTRTATNNGDGTWTFNNTGSAPGGFTLGALGNFEVTVIGVDPFGNTSTDVTNNELTINGGANITNATLTNICVSDGYQPLGDIQITETGNGDFGSTGTILLTLPSGFEFNTAVPAISDGSSTLVDIAVAYAYIGTATLQITVTYDGSDDGFDDLIIENLQVQAVSGGASGNLERAGGTASLLTTDTNYATLSSNSAPADLTSLEETSAPGTPITSYTAVFTPRVTITYTAGPIFTNGEDLVFSGGATGTMVGGTDTGNQFDMYLTSGTVEASETITGQTSSAVGTATSDAVGVSDILFPFTLDASTATANWYNGAGGLINQSQTNTNGALSATTPGLYTFDVADDNGTCESNPLRFNVLVYDDVHPDNNENTFVDQTYIVTDDRDTIFISNPAGHTVNVTGNGISVVGGGADPMQAIFDPAVAGDDGGGGPQTHTITYSITNNTTGESAIETVIFTVEPETAIFSGSPAEEYCADDVASVLNVDNSSFSGTYGVNPFIIRIFVNGLNYGYGDVLDGANLQAGNIHGPGTYTYDWDPNLFGVPDGQFENVRFVREIIDAVGTRRNDAFNYFLIYGSPFVTLTNVSGTYCEDDAAFTLNRTTSFVQSIDNADPADPQPTYGGETNQAIVNGYELYRWNGASYVLYEDFTAAGIGPINTFDPADPNQNSTVDANDVGQFRITYYTEALTPNSCIGQVDVFVTINPDTPTPILDATTTTGGGSVGFVDNVAPAAGVEDNEYLLEYCVGEVVANFTANDVNTVRWYDDNFNLIASGVTSVTPGQVGLSVLAGAFNAEQSVIFYFTSTDGTGCESDYRLVTVNTYDAPLQAGVDITGWPAAVEQGTTYWFEDCIPIGGSLVPADIQFDPLAAGEEYVVEQTFYFDANTSPTSGYIYTFNASPVAGSHGYGDVVSVPHTSGTANGFVYSRSGGTILLVLTQTGLTFNPGAVISNTTTSGTATITSSFEQYSLASDFIDVPVLNSTGFLNYFLYTISKTENINGSSNFAGCNGPTIRAYSIGWGQPTDVTAADLDDATLSFHVSEGGTLNGITHTFVGGMDNYVWYEDVSKNDTISVITSVDAMTQDLLDDPKVDGTKQLTTSGGLVTDRNDDGTNDVYTYYITRVDHEDEGVNAGFLGCESQTATPVTLTVHAVQPQPAVVSDNSTGTLGTPNFNDLDGSANNFYSICVDQLEADIRLVASEPTNAATPREFRWYVSNASFDTRGSLLPTDGSGVATFSELGLSGLNPPSTINRYFEVIQVTDNDVYEGVESESTFIRIDISPQDALEFRDNVGAQIADEFCRDDAVGSIIVDLFAGGSSAGAGNVDYEIDSYTQSNYNLSLIRTATIDHTASLAYTVGEIVTGGTSSATAEVVTDDGATMTVTNISGTFQVGEIITGGTSAIVSTSTVFNETTPGPDVDGGVTAGNPTLDIDALHDAVPGALAVGGEPTVHVITMTYNDPVTLCAGNTSKIITIHPDPDITIFVEVNEVLTDIAAFVAGDNEFCYEEGAITLQGALADGTPLTSGTFVSSELGALTTSNGSASFNPINEHNSFHSVTGTDGKFLNQSSITITYNYTDGNGCDNSVNTILLVNPEPEVLEVTGLPSSDLAEGNTTNFIRITDLCTGSAAVTAEIQLIDPVDPDPGSLEEDDYSAYSFAWTVGGSTVTDLNIDGLDNTIEFVPSSSTLNFTVVVTDLNGCSETFNETHVLQDLPDLNITGIIDNETFCADDTDPSISLTDSSLDGDGATNTVNVADIISWSVDSYSDDNATPVQIASGTASLPTIDLDSWHTDVNLIAPGTLVGGPSTYHQITIVYQDPSRNYQGIATMCSNTVVETIIVNPDPDISITLDGLDLDDLEFCYDDINIALQGIDLSTGLSLNGGAQNIIRIDGAQVSSNGQAVFNAATYHGTNPGDEFLPQSQHTIEYVYEDANGCDRTITRDFFVNPRPRFVGDAIQTASTCATSSVELFVDMTDGASNYTFTWFVNGQEVNGVDVIDEDGNNNDERIRYNFGGQLTANFGVTATYIGSGFSTNCVSSIQNQSITVGAEPIPAISWVGITSGNSNGTDFTITEDNATLPDGDVDLVELEIDGVVELSVPMPTFPLNFNFDFATSGTHVINLTMNTSAGCDVTLTRNVRILPHYTNFNSSNSYSESFESAASFDLTSAQGGWLIDSLSLDGKSYYDTATSWTRGSLIPGTASAIDGSAAVYTALGGVNGYRQSEVSFVYSPSFDLSGFTAPTVSFLRYEDFETFRDGAVFQVSVDDGRTWQTVGTYNASLEAEGLASTPGWYNREAISSSPGSVAPGSATASNNAQVGWALNSDWQEAISPIEINPAQSDFVRFRFAFSAQAGDKTTNGFGFDLVRIYERNQIVLLELFSSTLNQASLIVNDTVNSRPQYAGSDILKINYFTDLANSGINLDQINQKNPIAPGAKVAFYGVGEVPNLAIAGDANYVDVNGNSYSLLNAKLANARLNNPAFDIALNASVDGNGNLIVDADFTATTPFVASDKVALLIAVVEPLVTLPNAMGLYPAGATVQNVLRKLLPSAAGQYEQGPIASGATRSIQTVTWPINNMFDPSSLRVIAYAQDLNTKQIYQATSLDLATGLSNNVLGLEDLDELNVYPNPADKEVTVEFSSGLIEDTGWVIFDQSGKEVLKGEVQKGTATLTIETDNIPSGMYFIHLYGEGNKSRAKRIMVVH